MLVSSTTDKKLVVFVCKWCSNPKRKQITKILTIEARTQVCRQSTYTRKNTNRKQIREENIFMP